jgi:cytochrome c-type biogenesis protein CcmH
MIQLPFISLTVLAVALALLFALWPEIRSRFRPGADSRARLPKSLSLAIFILLPLVTGLLYLQFGTLEPSQGNDPRVELLRSQMIGMARELEQDPNQPEQWQRMGLLYKDLRQYGSAEHALRRALYLRPDSAFLRVELAEALQLRSELPEMPEEGRFLLEQAIDIQPDNLKALWLLGTDDFLTGHYENALSWWEQMLPLVPEDSSMRRALENETRRARDRIDEPR